jgi:hypothetical protein
MVGVADRERRYPIVFRPFEPPHLAEILSDPAGRFAGRAECLGKLDAVSFLTVPRLSWTGVCNDRLVGGCGGIFEVWEGRGKAWAAFGVVPERAWPAITEKARSTLAAAREVGLCRIEATVQEGFDAGHRWARRLGFVLETPEPMRFFGPDGASHYLYSRVER